MPRRTEPAANPTKLGPVAKPNDVDPRVHTLSTALWRKRSQRSGTPHPGSGLGGAYVTRLQCIRERSLRLSVPSSHCRRLPHSAGRRRRAPRSATRSAPAVPRRPAPAPAPLRRLDPPLFDPSIPTGSLKTKRELPPPFRARPSPSARGRISTRHLERFAIAWPGAIGVSRVAFSRRVRQPVKLSAHSEVARGGRLAKPCNSRSIAKSRPAVALQFPESSRRASAVLLSFAAWAG
jgi:hypothetical protein